MAAALCLAEARNGVCIVTKLGPHVILPTGPALDWAKRAPVIKSIDQLTPLYKAQSRAIVIFRHYWVDQGNTLKQGGAWAAAVVISKLQGFRHLNLYLEGMNETCQRLGQGLEQYVVWQQQFSDYCHARGYKVAGFSFSTGCPEPEDWWYVKDHNFGGCDVLSIHEYWGTQGFTIYNACRHRLVHGWLDGDHPPMITTECGRDRVEGGKGGWQADGITEDQYLAELRAYDAQIKEDSYILAATPFTSGPTNDWWAFDMDGISERLEGGIPPMPSHETLAERFPVLYSQWLEAGGDPEESFRCHLLGIGALPATPESFSGLMDSLKSRAEQAELVGLRLPNH